MPGEVKAMKKKLEDALFAVSEIWNACTSL
jgi:hypothetical protein